MDIIMDMETNLGKLHMTTIAVKTNIAVVA